MCILQSYFPNDILRGSPFPRGSSTNSLATSHHHLPPGPVRHRVVSHSGIVPCWFLVCRSPFPITCPDTPAHSSRPTQERPLLDSLSGFPMIKYSIVYLFYLSSCDFLFNFTFVSVSFIRRGAPLGYRYPISKLNAPRTGGKKKHEHTT